MPIPDRVKRFLKSSLFFPFMCAVCLWCIAFWGFLSGRLALVEDSASYLEQTKYLTDAFLNGVFPFWGADAFGLPTEFFHLRIGVFNPLYVFMTFLRVIGIPYLFVYLWSLSAYYFLGCYGFYLICRRLTGHRLAAFAGFLLLYFSSLGTRIFDSFIILTFVPLMWFFSFLVSFFYKSSRKNFLGIVFTLMLLMTTYVPFYFVTIFLVVAAFFLCFFPERLLGLWRAVAQFCLKEKILSVLGVCAVIMALIPGMLFFQASHRGDYVMPGRHVGDSSQAAVQVHADTVKGWSVLEDVAYAYYFSDFREMKFAIFYVPVFFWILICCGIVTQYSRRLLYYAAVMVFFVALGLPNELPLYDFLRRTVFFFKYFRNLHFFLWWVILPLSILFVVEQFKQLLEARASALMITFIVGVHVLLGIFCVMQPDVVISTIVCVIMSAMFFIFWYIRTGFFRTQLTLAFLLLVTVTVQPMQAYFYLNKNSEEKESLYAHETRSPGFHYDLHLKGGDIEGPLPDAFYIALGQVQLLASHVDWPVFRSYASKKFHVYARVAEVNNPVDWQKISLSIKGEINTVFVDGWDQGGVLSRGTDSAFAISNSKQGVEVLRYWENGIRFQTGFKSPKFLVYADAYHPHWSCRMDGNPCRIYRSNVAFKGLYLPPGEHLITLTFSSHAVVRYLLWMMFFGVFLSLCYMAWKDAEKGVAL